MADGEVTVVGNDLSLRLAEKQAVVSALTEEGVFGGQVGAWVQYSGTTANGAAAADTLRAGALWQRTWHCVA